MGSLVEELERREAAARAEADRLRCRIEELHGAEEQVTRPVITREEVARVLGSLPLRSRRTGRAKSPQGSRGIPRQSGRRRGGMARRRRCCHGHIGTCWQWRPTRGARCGLASSPLRPGWARTRAKAEGLAVEAE
jgi:hypothetical protein